MIPDWFEHSLQPLSDFFASEPFRTKVVIYIAHLNASLQNKVGARGTEFIVYSKSSLYYVFMLMPDLTEEGHSHPELLW